MMSAEKKHNPEFAYEPDLARRLQIRDVIFKELSQKPVEELEEMAKSYGVSYTDRTTREQLMERIYDQMYQPPSKEKPPIFNPAITPSEKPKSPYLRKTVHISDPDWLHEKLKGCNDVSDLMDLSKYELQSLAKEVGIGFTERTPRKQLAEDIWNQFKAQLTPETGEKPVPKLAVVAPPQKVTVTFTVGGKPMEVKISAEKLQKLMARSAPVTTTTKKTEMSEGLSALFDEPSKPAPKKGVPRSKFYEYPIRVTEAFKSMAQVKLEAHGLSPKGVRRNAWYTIQIEYLPSKPIAPWLVTRSWGAFGMKGPTVGNTKETQFALKPAANKLVADTLNDKMKEYTVRNVFIDNEAIQEFAI